MQNIHAGWSFFIRGNSESEWEWADAPAESLVSPSVTWKFVRTCCRLFLLFAPFWTWFSLVSLLFGWLYIWKNLSPLLPLNSVSFLKWEAPGPFVQLLSRPSAEGCSCLRPFQLKSLKILREDLKLVLAPRPRKVFWPYTYWVMLDEGSFF